MAVHAGVAAQARVHGARQGDLGGAGPADAAPARAVVRLRPGRLAGGVPRAGRSWRAGPLRRSRRPANGPHAARRARFSLTRKGVPGAERLQYSALRLETPALAGACHQVVHDLAAAIEDAGAVRRAEDALRVLAALHRVDRLHDDLAEEDHAAVRSAEALLAAVVDLPLAGDRLVVLKPVHMQLLGDVERVAGR